MSQRVVMTFHEKFTQYDLGEGHPYRGDRFRSARTFFEQQGLFKASKIDLVEPSPVLKEQILRVHEEDYVNLIFHLAEKRKPYDIDTPVSPEILEAALLIVGGAIACGKSVCERTAKHGISLGGGFHHAGKDYGGGFCLFNDVAILIEYLRATYNMKRFLVLDYDVHFGNGTSDIYYSDPTVLYISIHQDPRTIYPGTGFAWQIGNGKGEGCNVNVPLPPGASNSTYYYALGEIFVPLAQEFKPEIIIANGGSDSHFADMLGNLRLTVGGFYDLSSLIRKTANHVCNGKLVLMSGSGYNPTVLPLCWYALAAGVVGLKEIRVEDPYAPPIEPPHCRKEVEKTVDELKRLLKKYWSSFR